MAIPLTTVAALEAAITAAVTDGTWRVQSASFGDQTVQLVSLADAIDFLGKIQGQATSAARTRYIATSKDV